MNFWKKKRKKLLKKYFKIWNKHFWSYEKQHQVSNAYRLQFKNRIIKKNQACLNYLYAHNTIYSKKINSN